MTRNFQCALWNEYSLFKCKAQEKIAKHKVEIDILAGLVRDGLLKVEDAAPRVDMTVEEFGAAMAK